MTTIYSKAGLVCQPFSRDRMLYVHGDFPRGLNRVGMEYNTPAGKLPVPPAMSLSIEQLMD